MLLHGEQLPLSIVHTLSYHFNPRSRMESDTRQRLPSGQPKNFNPRSRMESDIKDKNMTLLVSKFQSTLSHGERRNHIQANAVTADISIHALAWRATTLGWLCYWDCSSISIHALAWRATDRLPPLATQGIANAKTLVPQEVRISRDFYGSLGFALAITPRAARAT